MVKQIKISDRMHEFSDSIVRMEKMKTLPRFKTIKDFHEYLVAIYIKENDLVVSVINIKDNVKKKE